jgi:hypothetical protein
MQNIYGHVDMERLKNTATDDIDGRFACWKCIVTEPCSTEPQSTEPIWNFDNFMELFVYPYPKWEEIDPEQKLSMNDRLSMNKKIKHNRTAVVKTFSNKGSYGEAWRPHVEKILSCLRVGDDYVNILPGFFALLFHLVNTGRDFSLIFRTFGDMHDIKLVTKEFNQFCEGKHPQYQHVTIPEQIRKRALYVTPDEQNTKVGYMFRHGHHTEQAHLIVGTIERPGVLEKCMDDNMSNLRDVVSQNAVVPVTLHTGYHNIYSTIMEQTKDGSTCSYRDFYFWWNVNNERGHSGKCFVVDTEDRETLQIFLDDNVYMGNDFPSKSIINLRNLQGDLLNLTDFMDLFLVQVEPVDAIPDRNFFIDKIELCEKNWLAYLSKK